MGECGLRGGYFELFGIPETVKQEIYKLASISLCSNTLGQVATGIMVQPPKSGDASYAQYVSERDAILSSMKRRAASLSVALNKLPGISCTSIDGAMYAFPTVVLPRKCLLQFMFDFLYLTYISITAKAIAEAKTLGVAADELYCMQLVEQTGIVVVPGSGFGQKDGTFHFRTTILPPEDSMQEVVKQISTFHNNFLKKYA